MTLSHVSMTFIEDFVTQFRLTSIEPHGSSLSWMVSRIGDYRDTNGDRLTVLCCRRVAVGVVRAR